MYKKSEGIDSSNFDSMSSDRYLGKYILLFITYTEHRGTSKIYQLHGVIESINPEGINISLDGHHKGQHFVIPTNYCCLLEAEPGLYTLCSTGEVVDWPDYLCDIQID